MKKCMGPIHISPIHAIPLLYCENATSFPSTADDNLPHLDEDKNTKNADIFKNETNYEKQARDFSCSVSLWQFNCYCRNLIISSTNCCTNRFNYQEAKRVKELEQGSHAIILSVTCQEFSCQESHTILVPRLDMYFQGQELTERRLNVFLTISYNGGLNKHILNDRIRSRSIRSSLAFIGWMNHYIYLSTLSVSEEASQWKIHQRVKFSQIF